MLRFRGGVHPDEHKYTAKSEIVDITPPPFVSIPLYGDNPVIEEGDWVSVGDTLTAKFRSHSSVSGRVAEISAGKVLIESDGYMTKSIAVRPFTKKLTDATSEELAHHISKLGIVSESAFLSDIINNKSEKASILLVSCGETEPFLCAEHRVISEFAREVVFGAKILMKAMNLKKIVFTLANNQRKPYKQLKALTANLPYVRIERHSLKYPADRKEILIRSYVAAHLSEAGELCRDSFVYVRPSVLTAVFDGFRTGSPAVSQIITVDGDKILNPGNIRVPIGCEIDHVLKETYGNIDENTHLISGGPISGSPIKTDDVVIKGMCAVIALGKKYTSYSKMECISCTSCHKVCPAGLYPMRFNEGNFEGIEDCIKCGSCSYVCPSKLDFRVEKEDSV